MVDPAATRRWMFRGLFFALCACIIFISMLPLTTEPRRVPGPDLLFCITAIWIMRRPRWAPVGLIVLVHLIADLLFLRPVGLWPAISLLGYEYLRRKSTASTEIPALIEFGMAMTLFAVMVAANAVVHLLFGIPHPSFGASALHVIVTAVAYPVVMAFSVFVTRVRRARPSDFDGSGMIS